MSKAAQAWLALPPEKRRYGKSGQVSGVPHRCVYYVACSHCKAKPGQLCRGSQGPTLGHHTARGYAFLQFSRRALRHPKPAPLRKPFFDIELRLDALEAQLKKLLNQVPSNRIVRSSARTRIHCKRCLQAKAWSIRARHDHRCPHGNRCSTVATLDCDRCAQARGDAAIFAARVSAVAKNL